MNGERVNILDKLFGWAAQKDAELNAGLGLNNFRVNTNKPSIEIKNNMLPPLIELDENKLTGGKSIPAPTRQQTRKAVEQILSQQPKQIVKQTNQPSEQVSEQASEQASEQVNTRVNPQYIEEYLQQLKDINQPYIGALQDYYKNYDKYLNDYHRARNFYTGLAGWTGNQQWADVGKDYNAVINEANRLNTLKTLQEAQAGDINTINEVMGNLAVAKQMELPEEAAFANKNLLTALMQNKRIASDLDKAQLVDAYRRYAIDQKIANALAVQDLRNKGMLDVANINAQAYGYGGQYPPAPGLTSQGQAQPVSNAADMYKNIIGR